MEDSDGEKGMRILFWLIAFLSLTSCGEGTSEAFNADAPHDNAVANSEDRVLAPQESSDGWAFESKQSPVQGTQYIAAQLAGAGTDADPFKKITITCVERGKQLTAQLLLESKLTDASFTLEPVYSLLLTPVDAIKGSAVTAQNKAPFEAYRLFEVKDYKNVASLRLNTNNNTNAAGNLAPSLPLAVELESNLGTILYEIPRSELVMSVVSRCVPDPSIKFERDKAQAKIIAAEAAKEAWLEENSKMNDVNNESYKIKAARVASEEAYAILRSADQKANAMRNAQFSIGFNAQELSAAEVESQVAKAEYDRAKAVLESAYDDFNQRQKKLDAETEAAQDAYNSLLD